MEIRTLEEMYIAELQELVSVETQLTDSLLGLAQRAWHPALKDAFTRHRKETQIQKQRLETILQRHGSLTGAHTDQAMQALLNETAKMIGFVNEENLRDVALIASAQKLKHYEIAAYGTATALAGQLEFREDQLLLYVTLEEEKRADELLTRLAKNKVNQDALPA